MAQSPSCAALRTVLRIACDILRLVSAAVRSHAHLAAENLFLRKQLATYVERQVKPRRADDATRIALIALSWLIDWRHLLTVVKPRSSDGIERVPVVLAMEVTAPWATAIAGRPAAGDR